MIRIRRPNRRPAILRKQGATASALDRASFLAGKVAFTFDGTIYGHKTVKQSLIKHQHKKCCFCESKVTHIASGHIEHFRPKGGVKQKEADSLTQPGYFWLAYEWTNLLFCCEICNSRFKKNLFPLMNPAQRARAPDDDLSLERPVFLDPASDEPADDPGLHIGYRSEYPFAIDGSARGEATWKALGLDREDLAELRRDHLKMVRALKKVRDGRGPKTQKLEAARLLTRLMAAKAQWSAMVKAAVV